jgi:hypothetical protein
MEGTEQSFEELGTVAASRSLKVDSDRGAGLH